MKPTFSTSWTRLDTQPSSTVLIYINLQETEPAFAPKAYTKLSFYKTS